MECLTCEGKKELNLSSQNGFKFYVECHYCNGTGIVSKEEREKQEFDAEIFCDCEHPYIEVISEGEHPYIFQKHYKCINCDRSILNFN